MTDEQKRQMIKLINGLPGYLDPAWTDDPDGCKLDVGYAKGKLLEIMQPSCPLPSLWQFRKLISRNSSY